MTDQIEELLREQEDGEERAGMDWTTAAMPASRRSAAGENGRETDVEAAALGGAHGAAAQARGMPRESGTRAAVRGQAAAEAEEDAEETDGTAWEDWTGSAEQSELILNRKSRNTIEIDDKNANKQVNWLYGETRRTAAAARYERPAAGRPVELPGGREDTRTDWERWDEMVRRDARRYDGSFSLF